MPFPYNMRNASIPGIIFSLLFFFCNANAQTPGLLQNEKKSIRDFKSPFPDTGRKNNGFAKKWVNGLIQQSTGNSESCNTSTFYMHLPALPGEKIELKDVQTLPDGNFIALCNTTSTGAEKRALIFLLDNHGSIVKQEYLRVNGEAVTATDIKLTTDGKIIIGGIENGSPGSVFILQMNNTLSIQWVKLFQVTGDIFDVKLNLIGEDYQRIIFAAQLNSSIACTALTTNNTIQWSREFIIDDLEQLIGFSNIYGTLGVVTNILQNGKQFTHITEIVANDGSLLKSAILGDGVVENKCFQIKSFYRLNLLEVRKSAIGFELERDKIYGSSSIETQHLYQLPGTIDFNISGAMDNASDVLGFCLPQDGKLIFIKQFSDYTTSPEHIREYSVPVGSSIAAIARSYDGGYLFGMNAPGLKELIFIKTDSIGILSGCSYTDVQKNYKEILNQNNLLVGGTTNTITLNVADNAVTSSANSNFSVNFDCNQNYCPLPPVEDSCLSTYYKTLRSNSYIDYFTKYFMMRNNNQLVVTVRYDRILQGGNQLSYGLKLFDAKGVFQKGVTVYLDSTSGSIDARQMDDKSILINSYSSANNMAHYTLTLVSDDLQIVWSKSFNIVNPNGFGGDPNTEDWCKDEEGNYYYASTNPGFFSKPKLFVYKMDPFGNKIWVKGFEFDKGYFETIKLTATKSSLIVLVDGFNNGSITARIDKATGGLLNSFNFQNEFTGSLYERIFRRENDVIFYAGNSEDDKLLIGLFDTIGKPLKLKYFNDYYSIPRAGNAKDGAMYLSFDAYSNNGYNDALVKVDTALNIVYMHEFSEAYYLSAQGLAIDDNSNVYVGGNFFYGGNSGNYADAFIKKYDSNGMLGTCDYINRFPVLNDIDPKTKSTTATNFTIDVEPYSVSFDVVPDSNGQRVSQILCSSVALCNYIKISGPDILCNIGNDYTYSIKRNLSCNLKPIWIYDTSFAALHTQTDSTVNFSFKKTGQTWLKARLNTGCTYYEDSILVMIQKAPALFSLGNDTTLCPGAALTLSAGSGFNNYQWQNGSTDSFIVVNTPGTYFVHTSNLCGDTYADTIQVFSAVIPALNIGSDTSVCKGDTLVLKAPSIFKTYNWQPQSLIIGQGAIVHSVLFQPQQFILNATTNEGCTIADSLSVNIITARSVYLGADTSFCDYDSVTLNAGAGYINYTWNTGDNTAFINVNKAASYSVTVQDANGCFAKDTLNVLQTYIHPVFILGADKDLCTGNVVALDPGNYASYQWQDGSTSRIYSTGTPGVYSVIVTDNNSCNGSDSIEIKSLLPLPANFLKATDSLCQYDKLQIIPLQNFASYTWSDGSVQPTITVEQPGTFSLTVKDNSGCAGTDTIKIIQKYCLSGIYIPNAFTPNRDGRNDVFRAKAYGVVLSFRLQVFNRFGQLVFSSTDPNKGWDGIFKGQMADTGTFVWQCNYQLQGGKVMSEKGTVLLIR